MLFSDYLINIGRSYAREILDHPIILSLAGRVSKGFELPRAQLEVIRQEFYRQDYFFLLYGYKIPRFFLLDCSNSYDVREYLLGKRYDRATDNPFLKENNPFRDSDSIVGIISTLETQNITIDGKYPNLVVQKYIRHKKESVFQGNIEAIVSGLPCLHSYERFYNSGIFNNSPYRQTDELLKEWINFLAYYENPDYLKDACIMLEILISQMEDDDLTEEFIDKLISIFRKSWEFELEFFESLIL